MENVLDVYYLNILNYLWVSVMWLGEKVMDENQGSNIMKVALMYNVYNIKRKWTQSL